MIQALDIQQLTKYYPDEAGGKLTALREVSLQMEQGECLGLIGESGSGKSTLARIVGGLAAPSRGRISFYGQELSFKGSGIMKTREGMQMIFQSPFSSFDPRMNMLQALSESICYREKVSVKEREYRISEALEEVGLAPEVFLFKRPGEMSGGECQRAAIARALLCKPRLLLCDEITSALDVSIQWQIIRMLMELQKRKNLALLFISHDIALVSCIADRIAILQSGNLVETGEVKELLSEPKHPYTKKLIQFCHI